MSEACPEVPGPGGDSVASVARAAAATRGFTQRLCQTFTDSAEPRGVVTEADVVEEALALYRGTGRRLHPNGRGGFAPNNLHLLPTIQSHLLKGPVHHGNLLAAARRRVGEQWLSGGRVGRCLQAAIATRLDDFEQAVTSVVRQKERLSLGGLKRHMFFPERRLQILSAVLDETCNKPAPIILSRLHRLASVPPRRQLLWPILEAVMEEWRRELSVWLLHGRVESSEGEFLVGAGSAIRLEELGWWAARYVLVEANRPWFLSPSAAASILTIGKAVAFAQSVCKRKQSSANAADWVTKAPLHLFLDPAKQVELERRLQSSVEAANASLMSHLLGEAGLCEHAEAILNYVCLRRGDWADHLLRRLSPILDLPADSLNPNMIYDAYQRVLPHTCLVHEPHHVQAALSMETLFTGAELGWDVFVPKYDLPEALQSVIDRQSLSGFLQLWKQSWELRRLGFRLEALSGRMRSLRGFAETLELESFGRGPLRLAETGNRAAALLQAILASYHAQEVVGESFAELPKRLSEACELDALRASVDESLAEARRAAFVGGDTDNLESLFTACTDAIRKQVEVGWSLVTAASEWEDRLREGILREAHDATARIAVAKDRVDFQTLMLTLASDLRDAHYALTTAAAELIAALRERPERGFRSLGERLNFSGFHQSERLAALDTTDSPAFAHRNHFPF